MRNGEWYIVALDQVDPFLIQSLDDADVPRIGPVTALRRDDGRANLGDPTDPIPRHLGVLEPVPRPAVDPEAQMLRQRDALS